MNGGPESQSLYDKMYVNELLMSLNLPSYVSLISKDESPVIPSVPELFHSYSNSLLVFRFRLSLFCPVIFSYSQGLSLCSFLNIILFLLSYTVDSLLQPPACVTECGH